MRILPLLAAFTLLPLGADAAAEDRLTLDWRIEPLERPGRGGQVQFTLTRSSGNGHWIHSDSLDVALLDGLTAEQLDGAESAPVRFRLAREAGAFLCEGTVRRRRGGGDCRFEGDLAFRDALERRGIGAASEEQLFRLSVGDVGLGFLDEAERQGYARPSLDELIRAANHGTGLDYLREMGRLGYRAGSLAALIRMRDHGVTPDYVEALAGLGYAGLSAEEVVRMRDHGVSADYVRALAGHGIRGLATDELVRLRDHGVSAHFVGRVRALGFTAGTADLIRMRDHGVSADFLAELVALGYGDLTPDEIVRLRSHGVGADFIRRANAGGRRSAEELVRLRIGG